MTAHDPNLQMFASDNYAGVHPDVLDAINRANHGHVRSYGNDPYTTRLRDLVKDLFGSDAEIYPTLTGTGSNIVALQALAARHESVICARTAHIHVDEGGAPERLGLKLLTVATDDGKLTPDCIDTEAWGFGDQHRGQPGVVSITQSTELGTTYRPEEISAVVEHARSMNLRTHLDGARIANAAAHLGVPMRAFTTDAGVDIVSLGATKIGGLAAEAVVVLNPAHNNALAYLRKGSAQLASKMRFISAQYLALIENGLWFDLARHANAMARLLADNVRAVDGVKLAHPVEANAVFAHIDPSKAQQLSDELGFYVWDGPSGLVRWMTSWDTTADSVTRFTDTLTSRLV